MRLVWSPRSRYDRELIFQRIGTDDIDAAERMDEKLNRLANGLIIFPQKGRPGRKAGTRELVAHPNYIVVYRIRRDTVEISRIIHAAQRWP